MNNAATTATLSTTAAGIPRSIFSVDTGDYIWHSGAFRRVTQVDGLTIRMGRFVLRGAGYTVEGPPAGAGVYQLRP